MQYIELGSAPFEEKSAQTTDQDFSENNLKECTKYKNLLLDHFVKENGREPVCKLKIKSFEHDFGVYREVCAGYNDGEEAEIEDAFWFDGNVPGRWEE